MILFEKISSESNFLKIKSERSMKVQIRNRARQSLEERLLALKPESRFLPPQRAGSELFARHSA
jgi:hypothetical protein